jgi:S1-C subfamily serine protease
MMALIVATMPLGAAVTGAIAAIRPAIVLVFLPAEDKSSSGVVIRTDAKGSDILTGARDLHIGSNVETYFEGDLKHPHHADVVKVDQHSGLALLHTSQPAAAQAALADSTVKGDLVAVLGYPAETAVKLAARSGELKPEAALGSVTSARTDGSQISTSAYTEVGDGGAPVFRQDDAAVVGVITNESNSGTTSFQAAGVSSVRKFLAGTGVEFHGVSESSSVSHTVKYDPFTGMQHLREIRGAGNLFTATNLEFHMSGQDQHSELYAVANEDSLKTFVLNELQVNLSRMTEESFSARLFFPSVEVPSDIKAVAQLARESRDRPYIGSLFQRVLLARDKSRMFQDQIVVGFQVFLIDIYGDIAYEGLSTKTVKRINVLSMREEDVEALVNDVARAAMSDLEAATKRNGDDGGVNFARFGIPLASGQKSALFSIEPESGGARVSRLFPYGTAARAHLQLGDLIVALDGEDLAKLSTIEIAERFNHHSASLYRCTLAQPDGHQVVVSFQAQDLRWYLEHSPGQSSR